MNTVNRRSFRIPAMLVLLAGLMAVVGTRAEAQDPANAYSTTSFAVNDGAMIDVKTSGGPIKLIGKDVDVVTVEMYVRQRGRYITEATELEDWTIDISKSGNTVTAHAEHKGDRRWNRDTYSIGFMVYAPRDVVSELRTSGGSIDLMNLEGNQKARTSGGSIDAEGIVGDIELRTSGGSLNINDVRGFVDANTSGGRIEARNVVGDLDVHTSGGSISLEAVEGNITASTSGGSITAEIMDPKERIELRTSGGSITVVVPKDHGYNLDLKGNRVRADLQNFTGEYERDEIDGQMNGGGTLLRARTSGGSVSLRYL